MYCTETRPYYQGAWLTAHSIKETRTKVTLVTDNMPGFLMQQGIVNKQVTAADKIREGPESQWSFGGISSDVAIKGFGGTERDMLPVAGMIDDTASILSVRGNVSENGMPRFFRRLAEVVFDEKDLIFRRKELHNFLDDAAKEHGFDRNNVIAIGYSNGANIAASLLFHHENALKGAILFHPMVPRRGIDLPDLSGISVFIGAGTNDPICTSEETEELAEKLNNAGADVKVHWEQKFTGSIMATKLNRGEIEKAAHWYKSLNQAGQSTMMNAIDSLSLNERENYKFLIGVSSHRRSLS